MRRVVPTPPPNDPQISTPAQFGAMIRAARTASGMTVTEASSIIGMGRTTLTDIELGTGNVSFQAVLLAAKMLGVSLFSVPSIRARAAAKVLKPLLGNKADI